MQPRGLVGAQVIADRVKSLSTLVPSLLVWLLVRIPVRCARQTSSFSWLCRTMETDLIPRSLSKLLESESEIACGLMCLNPWSSADGTIWEHCGDCRKWSITEESGSLDSSYSLAPSFPFTSWCNEAARCHEVFLAMKLYLLGAVGQNKPVLSQVHAQIYKAIPCEGHAGMCTVTKTV